MEREIFAVYNCDFGQGNPPTFFNGIVTGMFCPFHRKRGSRQ